MSGAFSNAFALLDMVLIRRPRAMDIIVPNCAIDELGRDRLTITNAPVEQGANINDHAYKNSAEVVLRWGWSNGSAQNALSTGLGPFGVLGFGSEQYDRDIYAALLSLQISRKPFLLVTGKRQYTNMLIEDLSVPTDNTSEYSLMATIVCKQLILVQTVRAQVSNQGDQGAPKKTAPVQPVGPNKPVQLDSPPSVLSTLFA